MKHKLGILLASTALIGGLMVAGVSAQDATEQVPATPQATDVLGTVVTPEATEAPQNAPSNGVALAIYNQGTALVQDRRTFDLSAGLNTIDFTDVASGIDPTSVTFVSLTDPLGTSVLEQNYVYDLVDSSALLAALPRPADHRDHDRRHAVRRNAAERRTTARSFCGRMTGRWSSSARPISATFAIRKLPGGLITRPTLRWMVQAAQDGPQQVELTYLTSGMNWSADYNVLLATDNQSLDLNGWVTLNNTSGAAYKDAQVKLVAGDVNRLPQPQVSCCLTQWRAIEAAHAAPAVQQRNFSEYKLYEVSRPVTVGANETKQVEFVTAAHVPAHTFFVYDASQPFTPGGSPITDQYYGQTGVTTVANYLEFNTGEDGGVGRGPARREHPRLPAGHRRLGAADRREHD